MSEAQVPMLLRSALMGRTVITNQYRYNMVGIRAEASKSFMLCPWWRESRVGEVGVLRMRSGKWKQAGIGWDSSSKASV